MNRNKYDYLIVGAGFFGSVFSWCAKQMGKTCLVIDKRNHIGGNAYTENINGINVHKYGAHIFHTNNKEVWTFLNSFIEFNNYINSPLANYKGTLYNLPFNMNTFYQLWGTKTPAEAKAEIERQRKEFYVENPKNLEEQAINLGGKDVYEKLIKGYSEKQWGLSATEIPAFIITRLPFRFTYNNNYFNDKYQGIPEGGYTALFEKLLEGIDVKLNCDFFENKSELMSLADKVIYTGEIDKYYDYCFGELTYRGLKFENELMEGVGDYQGNAVINYTEREVPYTRVIEHKHFEYGTQPDTYVTREYSSDWKKGDEPYYPVNNDENNARYAQYATLAENEGNVFFKGRLAEYKYYDMHHIVANALEFAKQELGWKKA